MTFGFSLLVSNASKLIAMSDLSSTIGAGSLFQRPNPAQLLRKSSKSKIKQPAATTEIDQETTDLQSNQGTNEANDIPVPAPIGSHLSNLESHQPSDQDNETSTSLPALAKKPSRYSLPELSYQSTSESENRPLPEILQIGKVNIAHLDCRPV